MNIPQRLTRIRCLIFPSIVVALLLIVSLPSVLIAKKVLGFLMMPGGIIWLGLMVLVTWPGIGRGVRWVAILIFAGFTLAGNAWFGSWLLAKLEAPYLRFTESTESFDAVCVLGGGTSVTPDGKAQLGPSGDRLIIPARLFLSGKTKQLVASGLSVTDINGDRSLADDTVTIWRDLGIPDTAIVKLSTPRTTAEEIQAYKEIVAKNGWKRVGVCSSAWHLRRVEKLCRNEGVTMIPVPADFLSAELPWTPMYAIPQARGFQNVQKALWEFLGSLTGG